VPEFLKTYIISDNRLRLPVVDICSSGHLTSTRPFHRRNTSNHF
jgi:hypothetical protein